MYCNVQLVSFKSDTLYIDSSSKGALKYYVILLSGGGEGPK